MLDQIKQLVAVTQLNFSTGQSPKSIPEIDANKLFHAMRYLISESERKDKELKELQEGFQQVNADYKALTDIMDRARRLAYLSAEKEEEDRPRFKMDSNGHLTRIEE